MLLDQLSIFFLQKVSSSTYAKKVKLSLVVVFF